MKKRSEEDVKAFGGDVGLRIYGLATVSDDWINQLKTYHKIDISDITGRMWFETMGMYIELFVARLDDLTTAKEQRLLEDEALNKIVHMFEIVNLRGQPDVKEGAKELEDIILYVIDKQRKYRAKHDLTIVESYLASFSQLFKEIPQELLLPYLQSKIELLEEENIRQRFIRELDK